MLISCALRACILSFIFKFVGYPRHHKARPTDKAKYGRSVSHRSMTYFIFSKLQLIFFVVTRYHAALCNDGGKTTSRLINKPFKPPHCEYSNFLIRVLLFL